MKYLSFLIKPSSLCNLNCTYCFYHDVRRQKKGQIMRNETMLALIHKAFDTVDANGEITFAFQGGEPTLAGISYFISFVESVNRIKKAQKIHYVLQTNGILIDDQWAKFLKENAFLVGISLDGYKEMNDFYRNDKGIASTYDQVMVTIDRLKRYQVDFNILTVLTPKLAKSPQRLYRFYKDKQLQHIQIIPCLPFIEKENESSLKGKEFASFYKSFYQCWLQDYKQGRAMNITLFDNLLLMYLDLPPQQCGMLGYCSFQMVVESDGSVYPCDFYTIDQYLCGNILTHTIEELLQSSLLKQFLQEKKETSVLCERCSFVNVCHGGCKRQNVVYFDGPNYCGYQDFLQYSYPSMNLIIKAIKK